MNTFNDVFLAVKEYCTGAEKVEDCFGLIAYNANVPLDRLDFYLTSLQDLGLLKFSWQDKHIELTALGKMQKRIFA